MNLQIAEFLCEVQDRGYQTFDFHYSNGDESLPGGVLVFEDAAGRHCIKYVRLYGKKTDVVAGYGVLQAVRPQDALGSLEMAVAIKKADELSRFKWKQLDSAYGHTDIMPLCESISWLDTYGVKSISNVLVKQHLVVALGSSRHHLH